jgi:hypothetical protein
MICYRPGTSTSRIRSAAVGLALLTMSSLLVCGADVASSAEWTATTAIGDADAFDKEVGLAPKTKEAAMAQGLDLRAEHAAAPPTHHRSLTTVLPFTDDTTSAPLSAGNNNTVCGGLPTCINGCHSRFYKVTGGKTGDYMVAHTCGSDAFANQIYVWKGTSSDCSTFACTGTLAALVVVVSIVLFAKDLCRSLT